MKAVDDVPVSITDDVADREVTFGDFRPTNVPLSAAEVEQRRTLMNQQHKEGGWPVRTVENTGDAAPIEEHEQPTSES